jgi:hypothetical protein
MFRKLGHFLKAFVKSLFGGSPSRGTDPYAGAGVRNRRGPDDRGSAVAVAEPGDE